MILHAEQRIINKELLHMCWNSSCFKIMNTKKIIFVVKCNGICSTKTVFAVKQNLLGVHAETNCVVDICVEGFLALRELFASG